MRIKSLFFFFVLLVMVPYTMKAESASRNLFSVLLGKSETEIQNKMSGLWHHFFFLFFPKLFGAIHSGNDIDQIVSVSRLVKIVYFSWNNDFFVQCCVFLNIINESIDRFDAAVSGYGGIGHFLYGVLFTQQIRD